MHTTNANTQLHVYTKTHTQIHTVAHKHLLPCVLHHCQRCLPRSHVGFDTGGPSAPPESSTNWLPTDGLCGRWCVWVCRCVCVCVCVAVCVCVLRAFVTQSELDF